MEHQVARALMERFASDARVGALYETGAVVGVSTHPSLWLILHFGTDRQLGAQMVREGDDAIAAAMCRIQLSPQEAAAAAAGQTIVSNPVVSGHSGVAESVLSAWGMSRSGPGAAPVSDLRAMVYDIRFGRERATYGAFRPEDRISARYDDWRIEGASRSDGTAVAVSIGLTDSASGFRPSSTSRTPPSRDAQWAGAGHELTLHVSARAAASQWHLSVMSMLLRDVAREGRPFGDTDWIDYGGPLVDGGTVEGFLIVPATWWGEPFALGARVWARFLGVIGVTRAELEVLETQREPLRVFDALRADIGNPQVVDPWRAPARVW